MHVKGRNDKPSGCSMPPWLLLFLFLLLGVLFLFRFLLLFFLLHLEFVVLAFLRSSMCRLSGLPHHEAERSVAHATCLLHAQEAARTQQALHVHQHVVGQPVLAALTEDAAHQCI